MGTVPGIPHCYHLFPFEFGGCPVTRELRQCWRVGWIHLADLSPYLPVLFGVVVAVSSVTLRCRRVVPPCPSRWDLPVGWLCRDCSVAGVGQNWRDSSNRRCYLLVFTHFLSLFWFWYQLCGHGTCLGPGTVVRVGAVGSVVLAQFPTTHVCAPAGSSVSMFLLLFATSHTGRGFEGFRVVIGLGFARGAALGSILDSVFDSVRGSVLYGSGPG